MSSYLLYHKLLKNKIPTKKGRLLPKRAARQQDHRGMRCMPAINIGYCYKDFRSFKKDWAALQRIEPPDVGYDGKQQAWGYMPK